MSYTIKKTDGTTLATVPENEIVLDAASIALVGRGATNYGVGHSENFVHLLENFSNITAPAHALQGQIWYDKTVGSLKVYNGTAWAQIGGGAGGTGADGAGIVYVDLSTGSALALVAGGKVVAALASTDVLPIDLPETIQFLDAALPFRAVFPAGLQAGQTLATDNLDFVYQGHVPVAERALYAGGGDTLAATTYLDLGTDSVALTVAGGAIIAAFSRFNVPRANLPTNIVVAGVTLPVYAVFPQGLVSGITFGGGFGIAGGTVDGGGSTLTIGVVQGLIDSSIATAHTTFFAEANDTFATASVTTAITTAFTSTTGQTTLSDAISWLLASSTEGTGAAEAGTLIRSEITAAITGASSFSDALSKVNTSVTTTTANSTDLTALRSAVLNGLGASSVSNAQTLLSTLSSTTSATSSLTNTIDATLRTATGQTTTAGAINTLWAAANADGSASAAWGFTINAQGKVAGIEAVVNSALNSSVISFQADKFKFWHPTSPEIIPFEIFDNVVYIKNAVIQNLSLGTEKITSFAINNTSYTQLGYSVYIPVTTSVNYGGTNPTYYDFVNRARDTSAYTIFSIPFNKQLAESYIEVISFLECYSPNDLTYSVELYRNPGNNASVIPANRLRIFINAFVSDGNQPTSNTSSLVHLDQSLLSGQYTYVIVVKNIQGNSTNSAITLAAESLVKITEVKK